MSTAFTELGPVSEAEKKSKAKVVRVKLLVSRTAGFVAHEPGSVLSLPEWEAERVVAMGQGLIVGDK